jgi:hypothetical protein
LARSTCSPTGTPPTFTHVAVWPDGYAAQDLGGHAPRPSRLRDHLRQRLDVEVAFEQLYQPNMLERLRDIQGQLRSVDIALTPPDRLDRDR